MRQQEILYNTAYGFYEAGQYEKAEALFAHLLLKEPFDPACWKGLASARQMQKKIQEALNAWACSALLTDDPLIHFHAAECYLALGNKQEALKALHCVKKEQLSMQWQEKITILTESIQ